MSSSILSRAPAAAIAAATISGLAVLVATTVHHVYGAWLFATPWRLHIVFISIPVAIAILAAIPIARMGSAPLAGQLASLVYIILDAGFVIGLIGFYEGGYNHLLPNIQYVLGVDHTLRADLYLPPDDLIFQLTGVAQFFLGVVAAWYLWRLVGRDMARQAPYSRGVA